MNEGAIALSMVNTYQKKEFSNFGSDLIEEINMNLSNAKKELLSWNIKLGHFHLACIQCLTRPRKETEDPVIPVRYKATTSCNTPICAGCQVVKQNWIPKGTTEMHVQVEKNGGSKEGHLWPWDIFMTNQFLCSQKGWLNHTKCKDPDRTRLLGGTIVLDHANVYMHMENQVSLNELETIWSKRISEKDIWSHGVTVQHYRGDNDVYHSKEFLQDL